MARKHWEQKTLLQENRGDVKSMDIKEEAAWPTCQTRSTKSGLQVLISTSRDKKLDYWAGSQSNRALNTHSSHQFECSMGHLHTWKYAYVYSLADWKSCRRNNPIKSKVEKCWSWCFLIHIKFPGLKFKSADMSYAILRTPMWNLCLLLLAMRVLHKRNWHTYDARGWHAFYWLRPTSVSSQRITTV